MVDMPPRPTADDIGGQELSKLCLSASSVIDDDSASTVSIQSSGIEVPPFDSPDVGRMIKLKGHPCAAGCGHFCWAANGENDDF